MKSFIAFIGLARKRPVIRRQIARPIASEAPAQKPNCEVRSVLPTVAFESTAAAVRLTATSGMPRRRPATR
nr:hypothetical protein [Rathayibacter sp. VKM Ac-2835]